MTARLDFDLCNSPKVVSPTYFEAFEFSKDALIELSGVKIEK